MNEIPKTSGFGHTHIDGKTAIYGLIGNPVAHSFSPAMQTAAFQTAGINAVYLPFKVLPEELPSLLSAFNLLKIQGFNVTVPYKQKIIPFLDDISVEARELQSVNTVIKTGSGWVGHSTDGMGFIDALKSDDVSLDKKNILIYGAGGACRAIAFALIQERIKSLVIINRTEERAGAIIEELKHQESFVELGTTVGVDDSFDIIINTTSVGMESAECPVPDEIIKRGSYVIDIVYSPPETSLLRKSKRIGIPYQNGIEMLLRQGVASFEIWTQKKAPIDVMRSSLLTSLGL